jgi:DNA-binding SARP family transcriptional activator
LGVLLLEAGRVVPVERLVDLSWNGSPPEHARRSIQINVARIRAHLQLAPDEALAAGRGGYALHVDPDSVDAHRFQALVNAARTTEVLDERAELLQQALALWRGTFMQDSATSTVRELIGAPWEAMRLDATEQLLVTGLAQGHEQELLPMLARVVAEHPARNGSASSTCGRCAGWART